MTDDEIVTTINLNNIPEHIGNIVNTGDYGPRLTIKSMHDLREWVSNQVKNIDPENHTIIVKGKMSNCIALQLGIWLAGHGTIMYQSGTGLGRMMI